MLKERTKEHRQQMVTEKASVLLLEDDDEYSCIVRNKNLNPDLHLSSENLVKFQNKVDFLFAFY